jgi:O-antigen/teichoic acid export membrane protein
VADRVESTAQERAAGRAIKNVSVRALAEIIGKLSTLVLFAAMGRALGPSVLGAWVFAVAYLGIALAPAGLGFDPYTVRRVAIDRGSAGALLANVQAIKLVAGAGVLAIALLALWPLGYPAQTRLAAAILAPGLLLDLLGGSYQATFIAFERSELLATALVSQRVVTAAAGLAVLGLGGGLVEVSLVYSLGAALSVALAARFTRRALGVVRGDVAPRTWPSMGRASFPFGVNDVLTVLLFKLDAVLLSLIASAAATGRYGAAYRLIDATLFVTWAIVGAFGPMFAYLHRDSEPTLAGTYGRSLKLALLVLVPVAVTFASYSRSIVILIYGERFESAEAALRILAVVVVLLAMVTLSASLLASKGRVATIARVAAAMVSLNLALNLVLIPILAERGAAIAMVAAEITFAAVALTLAHRLVEGAPWVRMLCAPLIGGTLMTAAMLALGGVPLLGVGVGLVLYAATIVVVERRVSPGDLEFLGRVLRRPRSSWAGP